MSCISPRTSGEIWVSSRQSSSSSLAMDPSLFSISTRLLPHEVVADEVDQLSPCSREDLLESLQHELVDDHVVHRGEVASHGEVPQVLLALTRTGR